MIVCGIDPGMAGGIATIHHHQRSQQQEGEKERDILDLIRREVCNAGGAVIYMESVHSFPGQGVVSSFTFGKGYGFLRGAICALGVPLIDVSPMKWKKALGIIFTAADSKKDKKNGSKALAQQWFPQIKMNHAISEALLIAEYGRRQL